ncbi:MAG: MFS transporter [Acidobacteria bacterium]|nr:MFS transporter [Acidobacteriota bacterium]
MIRGPLVPAFLVILVDLLAYSVILPLLPFYAESFGASPGMVGALLATFATCQLLAGPPLGRWSDRIGRKPVLLVSQFGTLAGFILLGVANSLPIVFAARILDGLTAGNITVAQAYIADVTPPAERTKAFGIVGIAYGVSFLLGPALSGYLVRFGPTYPIFTAALLSAVSIATTWLMLPPARPAADTVAQEHATWRSYLAPLGHPVTRSRFLQFFASQFLIALFFAGFALFAERRLPGFGPREVGYTFAYVGLVGIVFLGALGPVVSRVGDASLIAGGFLFAGLSLAVLTAGGRLPLLLVSMTFFAIGTAVLRPSLTSVITHHAPAEQQGLVIGLMTSLQSAAQIVAPVIAGLLIDRGQLNAWAWAGAVVGALGLLSSARRTAEVTPTQAQAPIA